MPVRFEILIEDASGEILLRSLLPNVLGAAHTYRTHAYKGIGRLPRNLRDTADPAKRFLLLYQLPRVLAGYGASLDRAAEAVVVIVDLDDKDCLQFKQEMVHVWKSCHPAPQALFRIAIEETESWMLGDRAAILAAFPRAKTHVLDTYIQDSICGTWEKLADAIHPGGAMALKKAGWPRIGEAKCDWARKIGPHMDVDRNSSKSFRVFRDGLRKLL